MRLSDYFIAIGGEQTLYNEALTLNDFLDEMWPADSLIIVS